MLDYSSSTNSNYLNQTFPFEVSEYNFFKETSELIQTLPISFYGEPSHQAIYRFVKASVDFWKKVIPPPEEDKLYKIDQLSESSEYLANVITKNTDRSLLSTSFFRGDDFDKDSRDSFDLLYEHSITKPSNLDFSTLSSPPSAYPVVNFSSFDRSTIQTTRYTPHISRKVLKGMQLFKDKFVCMAAKTFKEAADVGDIEACWRLAACYIKGIGVGTNTEHGRMYAEQAAKTGSIDGIFWLGRASVGSFKNEAYQLFKRASLEGHLAAKWWVGYCQFRGFGTKKDEERGRENMRRISMEGDGYWAKHHSYIVKFGFYGFRKDENLSKCYRVAGEGLSLCDCSMFKPGADELDYFC